MSRTNPVETELHKGTPAEAKAHLVEQLTRALNAVNDGTAHCLFLSFVTLEGEPDAEGDQSAVQHGVGSLCNNPRHALEFLKNIGEGAVKISLQVAEQTMQRIKADMADQGDGGELVPFPGKRH